MQTFATVNVRVLDANDERPRFVKREYHIEVDESDTELIRPSDKSPVNRAPIAHHQANDLLKLTVLDGDLLPTNQFNYKIVRQWFSKKMEKIRTSECFENRGELNANYTSDFVIVAHSNASSASLQAVKPVDYEMNDRRFIVLKVVVTDQDDSFSDVDHMDCCFVFITVRDINDNPPQFAHKLVNVTLPENVLVGTIVTKFHATDIDQNGHSPVQYRLDYETNKKRMFSIDSEGFVKVNRELDRETIPTHIIKVLVSDMDEPRLTSTATLVVNVEDINDNAPTLINTSFPPVQEGSPPTKIGELYATDLDDYAKGKLVWLACTVRNHCGMHSNGPF